MKSLYELVAPYDSVSLIGMCKNAGKTTTLNQLIAELKRNGVSFGNDCCNGSRFIEIL